MKKKIIGIFITMLLIASGFGVVFWNNIVSADVGEVESYFDTPDNFLACGLTFDGDHLWCGGVFSDDGDLINRVYELTTSGTIFSSFDPDLGVSSISGLAYDEPDLWILTRDNIHKLTTSGTEITSFGVPEGINPAGLAYDGNYLWYEGVVIDGYYYRNKIFKITTTGDIVDSFIGPGSLYSPLYTGLAYDGNYLWYSRDSDDTVYKLTTSGGEIFDFSAPNPDGIQTDLAWDGTYLWLAEWGTIYQIDVTPNDPPNTPNTPSGPSTLLKGVSGTYSTSTTDPDGDQVQYCFDWDADGSHDYSGWTDLVNSGASGSKSHSWSSSGSYIVKAQAKDEYGDTSGWSSGKTVVVTNTPPSSPTDLLCEGETNPVDIDDDHPEFSAIYHDPNGDTATKYEIDIGDDNNWENGAEMYDGGSEWCTVENGNRCPDIEYSYIAEILDDFETYYWRIRFYDGEDWGSWSSTASFTTGLLNRIFYDSDVSYEYWDKPWWIGEPEIHDITFTYSNNHISNQVQDTNHWFILETCTSIGWLGYEYEVPVVNGLDTVHKIRLTIDGSFSKLLQLTGFGQVSTIQVWIHGEEKSSSPWPYYRHKQIYEKTMNGFIFWELPEPDWNGIYTDEETGSFIEGEQYLEMEVQEGHTYWFMIVLTSEITTTGVPGIILQQIFGVPMPDLNGWANSFNGAEYDFLKLTWVNRGGENNRPDTPEQPSGSEAEMLENHTISSYVTDPDGDQMHVKWYWGDGTTSNWEGPYNSSEIVSSTHVWNAPGKFLVRVEARDIHGSWSGLSEPHVVNITIPELNGTLTLETPTGEDEILIGTDYDVTWNFNGDVWDSITIELFQDNGFDTLDFVRSITVTEKESKSYLWHVGSNIEPGENYYIVIRGLSAGDISDPFIIFSNDPPYTPSNPDPEDGKLRVSRTPTLSWDGGDPDSGDNVRYKIFLGPFWEPEKYIIDIGPYPADQQRIEYELDFTLLPGTIYEWRVEAYDDYDVMSESSDWGFVTKIIEVESCFLAGTQIAMADESYKNIENIEVGDTVKSYNITTREIVNTTVTKVHNHTPDEMTNHYLIINNNIKVTPNHIVFINDTLMRVKHAKVGDIIVGVNGEDTTIDSIEKVFKKVPTYNFEYMPMSNLYITDDNMGAYPMKIKIKNPMKPIGKFHIDKGVKYSYSTFTVDIASDKVFYVFDWGDGTDSGWLGPINSGETVEASHIWTEEGKYNIKVNAKDSYGELSEWSDPLAVAMVK